MLHTQMFKKVTRGYGPDAVSQLQVVEAGNNFSSMELWAMYVMHGEAVSSPGAKPIASPIINYWRRYFDIEEVPYHSPQSESWPQSSAYETESQNDVTDAYDPENQDEDAMSTAAQPGVHDTPVPAQIHQLATMLHNILMEDQEYNAPKLPPGGPGCCS